MVCPARYMSLLALVLALGILGEPAFPDTLPLLENLQNAPEAGTSDYSEYWAEDSVLCQKAGCYEGCAGQGEHPPALRAEVIFTLYYNGVEETYYQKGRHRYYQSCKIHKIAYS